MTESPHKAVDFIRNKAAEFGKAKSKRVFLEEFRKSKKALLMKDALLKGIEAANAQEREAYANPEYEELLQGLAEAIEKEETLKWLMTAASLKVEIWRSEEATNRVQDKAHQ